MSWGCCLADTHVIAEGNEIYCILKDFRIAWFKFDLNVIFTEITFHISRIISADMYITEEIVLVNTLHSLDHIVRAWGQRISRHAQDHAADLCIRHHLMSDLCCKCTCDQFMMNSLIQILLGKLILFCVNTTA